MNKEEYVRNGTRHWEMALCHYGGHQSTAMTCVLKISFEMRNLDTSGAKSQQLILFMTHTTPVFLFNTLKNHEILLVLKSFLSNSSADIKRPDVNKCIPVSWCGKANPIWLCQANSELINTSSSYAGWVETFWCCPQPGKKTTWN